MAFFVALWLFNQPWATVTHNVSLRALKKPLIFSHLVVNQYCEFNSSPETVGKKCYLQTGEWWWLQYLLVTARLQKCLTRNQGKTGSVAMLTSCCCGHYALSMPCVSLTGETWALRWGNKLPVSICIQHRERENGDVNYLLRKMLPCCFRWQVRLQMLSHLAYAAEKTISASSLLLN